MNTTRKQDSSLSAAAKRCLALLLTAELDGHPVEFHTWRAQNAKKIPLLDELKRDRAIEGDTHCAVTFWGLMNTPGKRAVQALIDCERVFKALRKHYPRHPKEPLKLSALARKTKLAPNDALQAARFLSRSPAYLSVSTHEEDPNIVPNEHYVTFKDFEEIKGRALDENQHARAYVFPALLAEQRPEARLAWNLWMSESKEVRESWNKALERTHRDPEGAITAGRSLLEAACKHVIDEFGESGDKYLDLPALYKRATALLKFDPRPDVDEPLRRVFSGCATAVNGIVELRNQLGDAHGKGRHAAKPAKRHAEFIVLVSAAMSGLLLATLDAQRTP